MNSFGFGLLVGFVAGVVFTALWNSEMETDLEPALVVVEEPPVDAVVVVEESPQEIDIVDVTTLSTDSE